MPRIQCHSSVATQSWPRDGSDQLVQDPKRQPSEFSDDEEPVLEGFPTVSG